MHYTSDAQSKLNQIQKLTALIKLANKIKDQLSSEYCPSSGLCTEFEYIQKIISELNGYNDDIHC